VTKPKRNDEQAAASFWADAPPRPSSKYVESWTDRPKRPSYRPTGPRTLRLHRPTGRWIARYKTEPAFWFWWCDATEQHQPVTRMAGCSAAWEAGFSKGAQWKLAQARKGYFPDMASNQPERARA
jgi:hypothetical protein